MDRQLDDAAQQFARLSAQHPYAAAPLVNLGCIHWGSGRKPQALECFTRAAQADPHSLDAAWNLGQALWACRRYGEARAAYESYLLRHPESEACAKTCLLWAAHGRQPPCPRGPTRLRFVDPAAPEGGCSMSIGGLRLCRCRPGEAWADDELFALRGQRAELVRQLTTMDNADFRKAFASAACARYTATHSSPAPGPRLLPRTNRRR